jgi:hypothetical protein
MPIPCERQYCNREDEQCHRAASICSVSKSGSGGVVAVFVLADSQAHEWLPYPPNFEERMLYALELMGSLIACI